METLEDRRLLAVELALLKDINPGAIASASAPADFIEVGSIVYFTAATTAHGRELWRTDGTAAGTVMVKDIRAGSASSDIGSLTNFGGALYFAANDGTHGGELWKSDGTTEGTVMVKEIRPAAYPAYPKYLTVVGGELFFQATSGFYDFELWKSDGTEAGTVLVKDIVPGSLVLRQRRILG